MKKYFNIFIEFESTIIEARINDALINQKVGYVCIVDGNVLTHATNSNSYRDIINGSIVNSCDGSSIALLAGLIHKQKLATYTGPEIFTLYIKKCYKQYFLGNTEENLIKLKARFIELGYNIEQFKFEPLPFNNVEDFNYHAIANNINDFSPEIIWVSLGAPKQEIFSYNLYPHLNKGVVFAIGAAFNLFLDENNNIRAPRMIRKMHLEWLFRVIKEPNRVGTRAINYLIVLPGLIYDEVKYLKRS